MDLEWFGSGFLGVVGFWVSLGVDFDVCWGLIWVGVGCLWWLGWCFRCFGLIGGNWWFSFGRFV